MQSINFDQILAGDRFYAINCQEPEDSLCHLEMKSIFQQEVKGSYFISSKNISPSRSPFIRHVITILFFATTLESLVDKIKAEQVAFNRFKFVHFKIKGGDLGYHDWIEAVNKIGAVICGESDFEAPEILLGAQRIEDIWIFGIYERNSNEWMNHGRKPHSNSHSLKVVTARALVNIATGSSLECTVVDPCCGVGTVVLEALSLGVNITGIEINRKVYLKAVDNIQFFGFENVIKNADMHLLEDHFDVAIIDIPYGLFTPVSADEQQKMIESARRIADRILLVTFIDMRNELSLAGFQVTDYCQIGRGNFKRHLAVCT